MTKMPLSCNEAGLRLPSAGDGFAGAFRRRARSISEDLCHARRSLRSLEIAVLCDLLEGHGANLKSHKKTVLEQLIAKKLVEPAKNDPTKLQLSDEARRLLEERGVGISGG